MTTILVVEDEMRIRQFVVANLKVRGYTVLEAGSAEDGLALLQDHQPSAIILDLKLPGMGGDEMLRVLAKKPVEAQVPVIIMSAYPISKPISEFNYGNVVTRLPKPLSVEELLKAVREFST